jgi:hypothetical protein
MMDSVEHVLGRILATLENIEEKLEKLEMRYEKMDVRITIMEQGYYKAVGVFSLITFMIGAMATFFIRKIAGA